MSANKAALFTSARIFSAYEVPTSLVELSKDPKLWIITEAENHEHKRSVTTLLWPSEY